MTTFRRHTLLVSALVLLLCAMALWSHGRFTSAKIAAQVATTDLATCQELADRVKGLADAKPIATVAELQTSAVAGAVEQASVKAQLAQTAVVRIEPEPARRVGDTHYLEKATKVALRSLTLQQLIAFLHDLSTGPAGLNVSRLQLTTPHDRQPSSVWDVEATVSYLIYNPPSPDRPVRGGGSR